MFFGPQSNYCALWFGKKQWALYYLNLQAPKASLGLIFVTGK